MSGSPEKQSPHNESRRDSDLGLEAQALMATVRGNTEELRRVLGARIRWPLLFVLAAREGATRHLYRSVSSLAEERAELELAPATLNELKSRAQKQELKILALDGQLNRLLGLFRGEGIDLLLLKGQALQRSVFQSPLDRPTNDLDLLVSKADAERSWKLAQENGWTWDAAAYPWDRYRDHHHLPPLKDRLGLRLEIHTELLPSPNPFFFPVDMLRKRARPLSGQPGVYVPCPEHLLLHASVHFAWSHQFSFGFWKTFRDVSALLDGGLLDWDRFLADTRECRGTLAAFWTLHLAREWPGIPVPQHVLDALALPFPAWIRQSLARHFASALASVVEVFPDSAVASVWLNRKLWERAMRPEGGGTRGLLPWTSGVGEWYLEEGGRKGSRRFARVLHLVGASFKDLLHLARIFTRF